MHKKQYVIKFEVEVYITPIAPRYTLKRVVGLIVSKLFDVLTLMNSVDDVYTTFVSKEEMVTSVRCQGVSYQKEQVLSALGENNE